MQCVARGTERPCSVKGCKQCVEGDAVTCATCEGTKVLGGTSLGSTVRVLCPFFRPWR